MNGKRGPGLTLPEIVLGLIRAAHMLLVAFDVYNVGRRQTYLVGLVLAHTQIVLEAVQEAKTQFQASQSKGGAIVRQARRIDRGGVGGNSSGNR